MARQRLAGLTPGRLRLGLGLLFVALALPTAFLLHHAYGQLKWEAFHHHRVQAEAFARRVEGELAAAVAAEEARPVTDYAFLVVSGDPAARYVTRSPLAGFPVDAVLPGTIGHFQVDADGAFSSPLVPAPGVDPARYGVGPDELAARRDRVQRIQALLGRNRVDTDAVADAPRVEEEMAGDGAAATAGTAPSADSAEVAVVQPQSAPPAAEPAPPADRKAAKRAAAPPAQALFDRLEAESAAPDVGAREAEVPSLGRVDALKLERRYRDEAQAQQDAPAPSARLSEGAPEVIAAPEPRPLRKEQNYLPAPMANEKAGDDAVPGRADAARADGGAPPIRTFESDVEPFRFALLDGDHFVLHRNVWRDGRRLVQGVLVAREPFLREAFRAPFAATALAGASDLLVAWRGDVLAAYSGKAREPYLASTAELEGELLHRARLSAPLGGLELLLSVTHLPPGPGATVLAWTGGVLAVAFAAGFVLLYRLGLGQIRLVRQQQDFVSAVSHELKTPLTSIRMYGEMLQQGWVDEDRRQEYYAYIHCESERLSRLIDNVLQLARLNRNGLKVSPERTTAGALCDTVLERLAAQIERAGFVLEVDCHGTAAATPVEVDPDLFLQVVINLVDNALKFSARHEPRRLDLACRRESGGTLAIALRDHGPGIPPGQMKKIFRLFYRPGDELTRETVGTGIGLALVHQMVTAMGGTVDVVNREPGAEFRVRFPVAG